MRYLRRRAFAVSTACCAAVAGAAVPAMMPTATAAPAATAATAARAPAVASGVAGTTGSPVQTGLLQRSVVAGTHPAWANRAAKAAPAPPSKSIKARVFFASRNPGALARAVAAVSTPGNPQYRHFITPAQFRAKYGPAPEASAKVSAWLRSSGLRVSPPMQNGRYVEVTGSVAAAQRAFATGLDLYRRSGATYQARASAVTIPKQLSRYVLTVAGLDESPARIAPKLSTGQPILPPRSAGKLRAAAGVYPPGYRNPSVCSHYYGQLMASEKADRKTALPKFGGQVRPYNVCGYRPSQLRSAYGVPTGVTGAGVTIAIIAPYLSPTLRSDADSYAINSGDQAFAPGQFSAVTPAGGFKDQDVCDAPGWSIEQSTDVEAAHSMAPGAKITYVAAATCSPVDVFTAQFRVVDQNLASIVSNSYGSLETTEDSPAAFFETVLLQQAAMQGIGFYFASGDAGDERLSSGRVQVNAPANNLYATAVGGTSIAIGVDGKPMFETGWGTREYLLRPDGRGWETPSFVNGSGGGYSNRYTRPDYQQGVVLTGVQRGRAVPDVAMDADPNTGMMMGLTQEFPDGIYYSEFRIGGTSVSTPLFAAVQALTSQAQHTRLGFANPRIYALAKQAAKTPASAAFYDVTEAYNHEAIVGAYFNDALSSASGVAYSLRTLGTDTSLHAGKGWDPVTGVGSPTPAYYTATGR